MVHDCIQIGKYPCQILCIVILMCDSVIRGHIDDVIIRKYPCQILCIVIMMCDGIICGHGDA